jgi:hypothetical protein
MVWIILVKLLDNRCVVLYTHQMIQCLAHATKLLLEADYSSGVGFFYSP